MKHIQEAVRAYLEDACGVKAVCDRTRVRGEYPLLAVSVQEAGTVLIAGGRLAEHTYQVTVTAVSDRDREDNTALLTSLTAPLLRGVPMEQNGERRILHPLDVRTEGEELTFSLELCVSVPSTAEGETSATETMGRLHLGI